MTKRNYGRELWDRMVDHVRQSDDEPFYECGGWTLEKLYFLSAYLAQTTQAMKGNPNFVYLNYIDLFANSGVCRIASSGSSPKRYPGSALLAAGCEKPFDNLFLVEESPENIRAVSKRISQVNESCQIRTWNADANVVVREVADAIPDNSLNVTFVDPYSLDVHFETIKILAERRKLDLLILFADDMDLIRNIRKYYYPRSSDKLDLFLGNDSGWRNRWDSLKNQDAEHTRQLFGQIYTDQLRKIGYSHSDSISIPRHTRPLYSLVYASKHPLGLKFWNIAKGEDLYSNRNLWGVP